MIIRKPVPITQHNGHIRKRHTIRRKAVWIVILSMLAVMLPMGAVPALASEPDYRIVISESSPSFAEAGEPFEIKGEVQYNMPIGGWQTMPADLEATFSVGSNDIGSAGAGSQTTWSGRTGFWTGHFTTTGLVAPQRASANLANDTQTATLTLTAYRSGDISFRCSVTLHPKVLARWPKSVTLSANPTVVPSGGSTQISGTVYDVFGNVVAPSSTSPSPWLSIPVLPVTLSVSGAGGGTFLPGSVVQAVNGSYSATFTPNPVTAGSRGRLSAFIPANVLPNNNSRIDAQPVSLLVQAPSEKAGSITLLVNGAASTAVVAGQTSLNNRLNYEGQLHGPEGQPIAGQPVSAVLLDSLGNEVTSGPPIINYGASGPQGQFGGQITSLPTMAGRYSLEVSALVNGTMLVTEAAIMVTPAVPYTLTITNKPTGTVEAGTIVPVQGTVVDRFNNNVSNGTSITVTDDTSSSEVLTVDGTFNTSIKAPSYATAWTVTARSQSAGDSFTVNITGGETVPDECRIDVSTVPDAIAGKPYVLTGKVQKKDFMGWYEIDARIEARYSVAVNAVGSPGASAEITWSGRTRYGEFTTTGFDAPQRASSNQVSDTHTATLALIAYTSNGAKLCEKILHPKVLSGSLSNVTLTGNKTSIPGGSPSDFRGFASDQYGNVVGPDIPVTLSFFGANGGSLWPGSDVRTRADGSFSFSLTPSTVASDSAGTLTAQIPANTAGNSSLIENQLSLVILAPQVAGNLTLNFGGANSISVTADSSTDLDFMGRLTDQNGKAIAGAAMSLALYDSSGNQVNAASGFGYTFNGYTDSDGNFSGHIWQLPMTVGTYTLRASATIGVTKTGEATIIVTPAQNSGISPSDVTFDLNPANQYNTDVKINMTLNGNTLSNIKRDWITLVKDVAYQVSGDTVTIFKDYLAEKLQASPTPYQLTFNFSVGEPATLNIYVRDTRISPNSATFDLNTGGTNHADVPVTLALSGSTLMDIKNGDTTLAKGTDYTISGSTVIILKSCLAKQSVGTTILTFDFSAGVPGTLPITVEDTTPHSSISPASAIYNKNSGDTANHRPVQVTLTLNGNTLVAIKNGSTSLTRDTDYYTVYDSTLVILDSYLDGQSLGTTTLTLVFSAGNPATLDITVEDTTPHSSISPTSATFDLNPADTHHANVSVTMALNGNSFGAITNNGVNLRGGTDFNISGNTVTIYGSYLSTLAASETPYSLVFHFSAGGPATLALKVEDTRPSSSISPASAIFDLNTGGANYADVPVTLTLNGNTFVDIKNGSYTLVGGGDYNISGSPIDKVIIGKSYLSTLPARTDPYILTFVFNGGQPATLALMVRDTTPENSVSPGAFFFDKNPASMDYADAVVTVTGNTLIEIRNIGGVTLKKDIDYTVVGNKVTILKSYLSTLPTDGHPYSLSFIFSAGYPDTLRITVEDTRPTIVLISPVDNIEVNYGTDEDAAISALADTTTIKDSGNRTRIVGLNWTIAGYDSRTAGTYTAVGTFELPAGVKQSNPETELKVTASVTVEAPSSANDITGFIVPGQVGTSSIDAVNHEVSFHVPSGTSVKTLVPAITISANASILPLSGIAQDFTGTVSYTVTAENGTEQVWTAVCIVDSPAVASPILQSAVTNSSGTKIILTFNKDMADPYGNAGAFSININHSGVVSIVTTTIVELETNSKKMDLTLASPVRAGDTITLDYIPGEVRAADEGILLAFSKQTAVNYVPVPVTTSTVTVEPDKPIQSITNSTPPDTPISITVPETVSNAGINVADLLNPAQDKTITSDPLPELNVSVAVDLSGSGSTVDVEVVIPEGTTVSVDESDNWDGTITMPTVVEKSSVDVTPTSGTTAAVESVIEIGYGDTPLSFNKAVRILIPGQAGKKVGYSRSGVFTRITTVLSSDDQTAADNELPDGGDGYINVGPDLVIWTKHFTKFVTYTEAPVNNDSPGGSPGGSSGGGGAAPPASSQVSSPVQGGKAARVEAPDGTAVAVQANSVSGMVVITISTDTQTIEPNNSNIKSYSPEYTQRTFGPEGTVFNAPVTITIPFSGVNIDSADVPNLAIYLWQDGRWIKVGGVVDTVNKTVSVTVNHFSTYRVMADQTQVPQRIFGNDRYDTAVQIAKSYFSNGADTVVLARGDISADALTAVPLAGYYNAPLLLTPQDKLPQGVLDEIKALGVKSIIIMGGEGAVSSDIANTLTAQGIKIKRIAGGDRYDTAYKTATELGTTGKAVIVNGNDGSYPDALSISSWAAYNKVPILYSDGTNILPEATLKALTELKVTDTILVGGYGVLPEALGSKLPNPVRYGGENRFDTNAKVLVGLQPKVVNIFVATGSDSADALSGAAVAGQSNAWVLLTGDGWLTSNQAELLKTVKGSVLNCHVVGGTSVVSDDILSMTKGLLEIK